MNDSTTSTTTTTNNNNNNTLRALSKSLSPSSTTTNTFATTAEIEQLRRELAPSPATHLTPPLVHGSVAPPLSFKLEAKMSRAHLANQLCEGSGQLYVHAPHQVPTHYYICAKSLFEFNYSLSGLALSVPDAAHLRLSLVLFAERENRYVYKLAEAYLPMRHADEASFQFFIPPITNPRHFLGMAHAHLPDFKMQMFVSVDNWTGFIGDIWCGQLRSTRARSDATDVSTESKLVGQRLRGRNPPPFLSENDDEFLKAAFQGTCHVKLAPTSVLLPAPAIDTIDRLLPALANDINISTIVGTPVAPRRKVAATKSAKRNNNNNNNNNKSSPRLPLSPSVNQREHQDTTVDTSAAAAPPPPPVELASPPAPATRRKRAAPINVDIASVTAPIAPNSKRAAFNRAIANLNATTSIVPPPPPPPVAATTATVEASSDNDNTTSTLNPLFGSSPDRPAVTTTSDFDSILMPPPARGAEMMLFFSSPSSLERSRTSSMSNSSIPFGSPPPLGRTRLETRRLSLSTGGFDDVSHEFSATNGVWPPFSP